MSQSIAYSLSLVIIVSAEIVVIWLLFLDRESKILLFKRYQVTKFATSVVVIIFFYFSLILLAWFFLVDTSR